MNNISFAERLSDLYPFANDKGIIEIVTRQANQRYKLFQKVAMTDSPVAEIKQCMESVMQSLSQSSQNTSQILSNLVSLQNVNLLLNGLNLCATCAGFQIMNKRLNEMSAQISGIDENIKLIHDLDIQEKFDNLLGRYQNMLDKRTKHSSCSLDYIHALINDEYTFLGKLIRTLKNLQLTTRKDDILVFTVSLASMLAASVQYYDELYYFEHHDWHLSHSTWEEPYRELTSNRFAQRLQDYGILEKGWHTVEVDVFYTTLIEQVSDMFQAVKDNQALIEASKDHEQYKLLHNVPSRLISERIELTISDVLADKDVSLVADVRESLLIQAAAVV